MSFRILRPRKDRPKTGWAAMPLYILVLLDFAATTLTRSKILGKFSSLPLVVYRIVRQVPSGKVLDRFFPLSTSLSTTSLPNPRCSPNTFEIDHLQLFIRQNIIDTTSSLPRFWRYLLKTSIFQRYSIHFSTPSKEQHRNPPRQPLRLRPSSPPFSLLPNNGLFTPPLSTSYFTLPTSPTLNLQLPSSPNSHRRLPFISSTDLITSQPIFDRLFILHHLWHPSLEAFIYIAIFRINLPRFPALHLQLHLWFPPQFTSSTPPSFHRPYNTTATSPSPPISPTSQSTFGRLFNL
jgi:hypothetical protein